MSAPPPEVLEAVAERLGHAVVEATPVAGGCIHDAHRLDLEDGSRAFVKWSHHAPAGMFAAEASGLDTLARHTDLRIPAAIAHSDPTGAGTGWILMEYVERGRPGRDFGARLASGLARMHALGGTPGWPEPNWIGTLPQSNTPHTDWAAFWAEERVGAALRHARDRGRIDPERGPWPELGHALREVLAEDATCGLLHGDLWSGNVFADAEGRPVLVDPAIYRGEGEVDLAMAELFGGFEASFFEEYRRLRGGRAPDARRRSAYRLYPLLVHVALFGGSYVRAARREALTVLS